MYVEPKKRVQMNLSTKQKKNHRCRKQTWLPVGNCGSRGKRSINWKVGVDIYTTIYKMDNE